MLCIVIYMYVLSPDSPSCVAPECEPDLSSVSSSHSGDWNVRKRASQPAGHSATLPLYLPVAVNSLSEQ